MPHQPARASTAQAPDHSAALLAEARAAWRCKRDEESNLKRLSKYKKQRPGMKHDRAQSESKLIRANATLQRVLGGAA